MLGSSVCNLRVKKLFDFVNETDLKICNRDVTPSFVFYSSDNYPGWSNVIDVTLVRNGGIAVENWHVSSENSFSDHKCILFICELLSL
uniref:Endonuclease/exonuclease/phosphatase domain-containing protein n=1 Tax=Megaselia scalaris TaxID=36166 RepID=T1GSM4_MEGSC